MYKNIFKNPFVYLISSMKFAIALLFIVAIASIIGTLLPQNQIMSDYVILFGIFWVKIFDFLGLFDIYSSLWFCSILSFLIISTSLCLLRKSPDFIKEMKSYKLKTSFKSLSLLKQTYTFNEITDIHILENYIKKNGFSTKILNKKNDNEIILAAKNGSISNLGYIFTHFALIIICFGGLLNSDLWIKAKIILKHKTPDKKAIYPNEFNPKSILDKNTISYTSTINIPEKSSADFSFIYLGDNGYLLQILPYYITLNKFDIIYYDNGMPKDFISDITITNKKTKKQINKIIKVNHPFRIYGTTIYQANFADGGSKLFFKAWNLNSYDKSYKKIKTRSKDNLNFKYKNKNYKFSFLDFKSNNVEKSETSKKYQNNIIENFFNTTNKSKFINIGPSINYQIQDPFGINYDHINYMLPIKQGKYYYYFYGYRKQNDVAYKFFGIPIDFNGLSDTFFLLREGLSNKLLKNKVAKLMSTGINKIQQKNSIKTINIVLTLFEINGYQGIDNFIKSQIPIEKQAEVEIWFYKIISIATSEMLKILLQNDDNKWKNKDERANFIINSLQALSAIKEYPSPLLLQLYAYEQILSSGLQITKSPGAILIYLGAILLILGIILIFYIQQKRAWFVFKNDKILFAMSSNKNKKKLQKEFNQHIENLKIYFKG